MVISKHTQDSIDYIDKTIGTKLTFGSMLASIRKCDGITQTIFAKMLGISKQYLCDVEHGRKLVSPKKAYEYAIKLGYCSTTFVMLAVQDELRSANLPFEIDFTVKPQNLETRREKVRSPSVFSK